MPNTAGDDVSKVTMTTAAEVACVLVYGLKNGLSPALREEVLSYLRLERQRAKEELSTELDGQGDEPPPSTQDSAARRQYARACRAIWLLTEATEDEEERLDATLAAQGCPPIVD